MSMYNKLFTKILDSSIWLESDTTRIVWLTLLAAMDEDGFAQFASVANLAHRARVPLEACQEAVRCLEGEDPNSADPDHGGRRLERVSGGWMVLNAEKYRLMVTRLISRERTRERVARFRGRVVGNASVTPANADVTPSVSVSISKSETKEHAETAFDVFWKAYPKKTGKGAALKVWEKLRPSPAVVTQMLEALKWQVGQPAWSKDGGAYVPNPATYLNQARWDDEPFFAAPVFKVTKNLPAPSDSQSAAVAEAMETRRRRAEMQAQGMSDDAIEAVFEREYLERRKA